MLVGENGIITQAQNAKEENEKAEIIESIQLEIADKQAENLGTINEDEFYEILGRYGTISTDETTLTTTKGNYEILISDIYNGEIASSLVTTPLSSWEYNLIDNTIRLNKYTGIDEKIFIPNTFTIGDTMYDVVISITDTSKGPFRSNTVIKQVKFGDNVRMQNDSAVALFYYCSNLEKVYNFPRDISGSLSNTFVGCSKLISIPEIPSTITEMNYTFAVCSQLTGTIVINANNITSATGCFNGVGKSIILKIEKNTVTRNTFETVIENLNNVRFYDDEIINISCWGDSLTAGAGGNGTTYPGILKSLCGKLVNINRFGVGGENSKSIAIRQGAIPIYTNSFIIPSDTTTVEIEIKDSQNTSVSLANQGVSGLNPSYINDIAGNISRDGNKYYFTRSNVGESITVQKDTRIITEGMKNHRDDLMIIWSGTNDTPNTTTIQNVINNIDSMIEYSSNPNYIVIGLTSKYYMAEVEQVNEILSEKYGEHFLDIRTYILENGLADAEIDPTEQDETDIANGEIPSSLRSDDVHLNAEGYTIVGTQVYNKLISLGYIEE